MDFNLDDLRVLDDIDAKINWRKPKDPSNEYILKFLRSLVLTLYQDRMEFMSAADLNQFWLAMYYIESAWRHWLVTDRWTIKARGILAAHLSKTVRHLVLIDCVEARVIDYFQYTKFW